MWCCRFTNPVAPPDYPLFLVEDFVHLDLAYSCRGCFQAGRDIVRTVPAVTKPPFVADDRIADITQKGHGVFGRCAFRKEGNIFRLKHTIIDADFIDIPATNETAAAGNQFGIDNSPMRAHETQTGIKNSGRVPLSHK